MSDAAAGRDSLAVPIPPRTGPRAIAGAAAQDPLTAAVVLVLVGTWLVAGVVDVAGLPHGVVTLVDPLEVLLCVWLALRVVRARGLAAVPIISIAYLVWVAAGLATDAPPAAVATALKHLLVLPALALLIAWDGTTERRARVFVVTLLALAALEFSITLVQSVGASNADEIVGSFGPSANAVAAAVVLMAASVAFAGYLVQAPYARVALATAATLPVFAAWTLAKFVPIAFPICAVAMIIVAGVARRASWRRGATAFAAAALSTAAVLGSYAAFNRDSLSAISSVDYLRDASVSTRIQAVTLAGVVLSDYRNADVSIIRSTSQQRMFRAENAVQGDYTVWIRPAVANYFRVEPHRRYSFSATIAGASRWRQTFEVQIDWLSSTQVLDTKRGHSASFGFDSKFHRLRVSGKAPPEAAAAVPKIAVVGEPDLKEGSAVFIRATRFRRGSAANAPAPPDASRPPPVAGTPDEPQQAAARPVPGRLTQWRMAEHAISGSLMTELLGKGIGSATVADNLGVHPGDLSADAEAASYSDFGTLLVERGWVGVAVVALLVLVLVGASIRVIRTVAAGAWASALAVAVPGVICLMAAYGMIAAQLRSRPAALTFWLIVGLGLSPGAFLGGSHRRTGGRRAWGRERGTEDCSASATTAHRA